MMVFTLKKSTKVHADTGKNCASVLDGHKLDVGDSRTNGCSLRGMQFIWSNYSDLTPNGGLGRVITLFQGNLGW